MAENRNEREREIGWEAEEETERVAERKEGSGRSFST